MNCREFREIFSDYLEGTLEERLRLEADEHLARCADCSALVERAGANIRLLSGLPDLDPGDDLLKKLYSIAGPPEKTAWQRVFDFLGRPSVQPLLTALTVLMIFFTFLAGHPDGKALRKSFNRELHEGYSQIERLYAKTGKFTSEVGNMAGSVFGTLKTLKPEEGGNKK